MKFSKFLFAIFSLLFFLSACMPKPVVREFPATYNPIEALFEEAEQYYQAKNYEQAIKGFNKLISEFPDSPEASVAMFKNGIIYKEQKNFHQARASFRKILEKYPSKNLAEDAKIEILNTYFLEGNYHETIRLASQLFKRKEDGTYPLKVYVIVGNAYFMAGEPEKAVKLFSAAHKVAPPQDKDKILEYLKSSIQQIPSDTLSHLINQMDDRFPKGYLMVQLGLNQVKDEKYPEALSTLNEFTEKFPFHRENPKARHMIEHISRKVKKDTYIIGCLLPLTGKYKNLGQSAWSGIELALAQFDSTNQHPLIKMIVRDTGSDGLQISSAFADLVNNNVSVIIGPMINAEIAAQEAQNQKIPIITLTLASKITDYGDYVFRNFLTPEIQIHSMVSFLINSFGLKRFAILYPEEKYGTIYMNLFWDEVVIQGGTVVGAQSYDQNMTDFRAPIQKISRLFVKKPDRLLKEHINTFLQNKVISKNLLSSKTPTMPSVDFGAIFIPDTPDKAAMIIPQLAYHDISGVYFLGTNLWHGEDFIQLAGDYAHKSILTDGFFPGSSNEQIQSFVKKFETVYGHTPGFVEAIAYDTAILLMEIFAEKNIENKDHIKEALLQLRDFPGITGKTSFDSTGEAQKETYVLCVKNKTFMELKRP